MDWTPCPDSTLTTASTVARNLRAKEVVIGEGECRRRYVVCNNPEEEKRQRAPRRQVLYELEAELASLQEVRGEGHSKRVCQLRAVAMAAICT